MQYLLHYLGKIIIFVGEHTKEVKLEKSAQNLVQYVSNSIPMYTSNYFLSCDWGTSSFRLRLVNAATETCSGEITSNQGIARMFAEWQQASKDAMYTSEQRMSFYLQYLHSQIKLLANQVAQPLYTLPVLISGMASSSIGMKELQYTTLPFQLDGSGVPIFRVPTTKDSPHEVWLISGIKSEEDVMRGEETQLIGLASQFSLQNDVCIFPGTHSKHMYITRQELTGFKTYMTGEVFQTIASHTILQNSIDKPVEDQFAHHSDIFRQGVTIARKHGNILHSLFTVRTADLFKKFTRQQNYYYLSGLLIGQELTDLQKYADKTITICCGTNLLPYYSNAIESLGYLQQTRIVSGDLIDTIVTKGQLRIFHQVAS